MQIVKSELENGEKEILCSLLTANEKYVDDDFEQLYHFRLNEEEAYKLLKSRIEVENFSGKTARVVKQDFFAKAFFLALCAAYAYPIKEKVIAEFEADKKHKHRQKNQSY